ncbi:helix-turn-helix domain-containing protein [Mycobacterium simulans]|uniref:helix-turn-helix domain-containing protein n=1 Tax=Mycobacterium simulans TaxID=627089 RepID=UPI0037C965BD
MRPSLGVPRQGFRVRSAEQFEAARRLIAAGVNDCAIARQIGVPRTTVRDWRCRPQGQPRLARGPGCGRPPRLFRASTSGILLRTRSVSRRRLHLAEPAGVASAHHARQKISRHH